MNLGPSLGTRAGRHRWRPRGGRRVQRHLRRRCPGQRQHQDPPGQQDTDDLVGAAALERRHHRPGHALRRELLEVARASGRRSSRRCSRSPTAASNQQGCGDWTTTAGDGGAGTRPRRRSAPAYKALFYDVPARTSAFGTAPASRATRSYTAGGAPNGVFLPVLPGVDDPTNIQAGGVVGNNDWIGPNPNPFPTGSAPTTAGGTPIRRLQRAEHGAAHQRSVPGHRSGRRVGQHEHRYRDDSGWSDDRSGLAGRHAGLLRWPGEPVREHPGQERRHRRHREPRDEDQLDRADHGPGRVQAAGADRGRGRTRPASSTAARSSRALCRTTSRASV